MSYQYGYAPHAPFQTDRRPPNAVVVAIAWICAVLTSFYMLPWAIAATRGKSNQAMIGVLNLLLGWTVVGWIIALVMSCTAHQAVAVLVAPQQAHARPTYGYAQDAAVQQPVGLLPSTPSAAPIPAGWYGSPGNQGQEYWDGTRWTGHRAP